MFLHLRELYRPKPAASLSMHWVSFCKNWRELLRTLCRPGKTELPLAMNKISNAFWRRLCLWSGHLSVV